MRKMTPVMPSTKKASSRMANAGVDTGEKMFGVGPRPSAAAAKVGRNTMIPHISAARQSTAEL